MKLIIYTDGASRGNPGPSSYGFTITDETGQIIHEEGEYIGITTNNVAEYTGYLSALKKVKEKFAELGLIEIDHFADSRLVVEQLSGRFKVKSPHLREIISEIRILERDLGQIIHKHIFREKNTLADRLANIALDSKNFKK